MNVNTRIHELKELSQKIMGLISQTKKMCEEKKIPFRIL